MRMHEDQIDVPEDLVRRLVDAQHPQWAGLPLRRVASTGTVHALYRLGDELVVRLPLRARFQALAKELEWLPRLAPILPLAVPEPVAAGDPAEGFPWAWAVFRWVDGETWRLADVDDACAAAEGLAAFVHELRRVDPSGAPPVPPVRAKDAGVRWALGAARELGMDVDCDAIEAAWEEVLAAPDATGPPVAVHGDLLAGNVLVTGGRLHAVIDWGGFGAGDPALDLVPAWSLFDGESSTVFRRAFPDADGATWSRARGLALSRILNVPYYRRSNPRFVEDALETLERALRGG